MKKITTAGALSLAALLLTVSASAYAPGDMAASGQETLKVYSTANAPVLDGVVKTGEYNEAIRVLSYGDAAVYFNGDEEVFSADELKSILPSAMALYATYDDSFLYIACETSDPSHYTPLEGTGVWDGDYLEFDIGLLSDDFSCYNDKLRLAIGMCSEDDSVCAYSALNPKTAAEALELNVDLDGIAAVGRGTNGVTTYEAAIPWKNITSDGKAPEKAFFYYQLGIGDERFADRSEYEAYLGVYRYASPIRDEALKEELGVGAIPNLMTFAGAPAAAETPASAAESGKPAEPSTPAAPQTADLALLSAALLALSGALIAKKKSR